MIEETHDKPCSDQNLKWGPPEYKFRVLSVQPAWLTPTWYQAYISQLHWN